MSSFLRPRQRDGEEGEHADGWHKKYKYPRHDKQQQDLWDRRRNYGILPTWKGAMARTA